MKFPRNARIFRGQLDAAPFISVFFLLVIFVMLGKRLYEPGIPIQLPAAGNLVLAGPEGPTISVAVTTNAIYFDDRRISENDLSNQLVAAKQKYSEPVTVILQVDKDVTEEKWSRLWVLAAQIGITNLSHATLPRVFESPSAAGAAP
jgi:biopolymer transport protein ExbD